MLSSAEFGCEAAALTLAALLSVTSPFVPLRPADLAAARAPFAVYEGDAITLLNVHRAYQRRLERDGPRKTASWCRKHKLDERVLARVGQVRQQLAKHLRSFGDRVPGTAPGRQEGASASGSGSGGGGSGGGTTGTDAIRRALVRGYFANAAQQEVGGHYSGILRAAPLRLHPNSTLYRAPPAWLLFHETVFGKHELILSATKVDEAWLAELAPHFYMREAPGMETRTSGAPRPSVGGSTSTMGEVAAAAVPTHLAAKRSADAAGLDHHESKRGFAEVLGGMLGGQF